MAGRPGPTVGLEHVAVDQDLPLAEHLEIDDAAKRAADQPLDLVGATGLATPCRLPAHSFGRGARQQRVLRGHPAPPGPAHPSRHVLVDGGRAQDLRATVDGQHRAGGEFGEVPDEHARAQLVEGTPVVACQVTGASGRESVTSRRVADRGRRASEVDDPPGPFDDHVQVVGPSPRRQVLPPSVGSR